MTKRRSKGQKISFIAAWKVDGAFVNPKGITKNSKWPPCVRKAVLFQGHINPFVNLALGLASKGCTITYVRNESIHHQTRAANWKPDSPFSLARESGHDIRHVVISDGLPLDFDRDLNFVEFMEAIEGEYASRVDELVGRIRESEQGRSAPFLVADSYYLWMPEVAKRYNMVYVSFWPSPAQLLSIGHHLALLQEKGISCTYDNYKDHMQEIAGGKKNITDFIKYAPRADPFLPEILSENISKVHLEVRKADFILCNTVEELEPETLSTLNQKQHLPTYAIGPTNFLARMTTPISSSLKSQVDCSEWLSSKPQNSVLLISFGSVAQTEERVIMEIAHALQSSRFNFVWVLRPDAANGSSGGGSSSSGSSSDVLPPQFGDQVAGRGLIVPWCDQRKVLSSPAVGGFLTHCGWSSILESVWFGVPMICYPVFLDQPTNRNMVVYEWKVGINLCDRDEFCREEVSEKIEGLMATTATTSSKLRMEMKRVSKIMHNAVAENGSSDGNLDKFLNDLKDNMCMLGN